MKSNTKIAGMFNYPAGKNAVKALTPGAALTFQREPSNAHDRNAIAIYAPEPTTGGEIANGQPVKIGYVPKELAATLAATDDISIAYGNAFGEITISWNEGDAAQR